MVPHIWKHLPEHPDDVILRSIFFLFSSGVLVLLCAGMIASRTKQWMSSPTYDRTILLYPRHVALEKLQIGLPQGWVQFCFVFELMCKFHVRMIHSFQFPILSLFLFHARTLAAIVEKKELGEEYKNHVRKFLPALRYPLFDLSAAADWLEALVDGSLPSEPLLDVSAILSCTWKILQDSECISLPIPSSLIPTPRAMITTGLKQAAPASSSRQPNEFSIHPNDLRPLLVVG